jgi:hypothetical protein
MKPLCVELYCGSFGWSKSWLDLGGRAIGFDLEHHPWHGPVPENAELVLQDVLTLNGAQFRDADLILASPPCQEFSYRAMPWKRAKALPPPYLGMKLFWACWRIQQEACEAAGRYIPMVVENVVGAQRWIGAARWHFGSYYLWGDVPALMPPAKVLKVPGFNFHQHEKGQPGGKFQSAGVKSATSNIAMWKDRPKDEMWSGSHGQNPDGREVPVYSDPRRNGGKGAHLTNPRENEERLDATKQGGDWWNKESRANGSMAQSSSRSDSRKAASAVIARIPEPLSRHIAECFLPVAESNR